MKVLLIYNKIFISFGARDIVFPFFRIDAYKRAIWIFKHHAGNLRVSDKSLAHGAGAV